MREMITYLQGDATSPQTKGPKLIVHICNDAGKWGAGFVLAVTRRWHRPEEMYRRWYQDRYPVIIHDTDHVVMTSGRFQLGETQLVQVQQGLYIVNMVAQSGTRTGPKGPPIRYGALDDCLGTVASYVESFQASVHMPRIGTGLAGGKWDQIEPLIQKRLGHTPVFVYDLSR
jgi:O-acetyl-ADP-ribose deacetylase (regulator of RNase III)